MTTREAITFVVLRSIGNFLVLFAIFGVFATFGPAVGEEAKFRVGQVRGVRYRVEDVLQGGPTSQEVGPLKETERVLIPKDTQFSILIPKIAANAKVFPNVDASDENEFLPVLQEGVAHARGTVFPGMKGNIYLFAHSVDTFWNVGRYNAVFYLLKDLEEGDDVVVFFEGRRYNYTVRETKVVEPEDVAYLTQGSGQREVLILQSCWPPGTTWKRLIVLASPR